MNYDKGRVKVTALFPPLHQQYCIVPKTKDGHTCVQMLTGGRMEESTHSCCLGDATSCFCLYPIGHVIHLQWRLEIVFCFKTGYFYTPALHWHLLPQSPLKIQIIRNKNEYFKKMFGLPFQDWGYSSMVDCLTIMHETLDLIPST